MKRTSGIAGVVLCCCLGLASTFTYAAARGPSTPEERAQALSYAHDLETNPLGSNAATERRWITTWLIDVPDISVPICTAFFPKLPKAGKKDSTVVFGQMLAAGAAFVIQNPDQKDDKIAIFQAEVEGALRAYESLVKIDPKDTDQGTDDVLRLRENGSLADYVKKQAAEGCGH